VPFSGGSYGRGDLAAKAARHYRTMRAGGAAMNKIAALFIGTFCIEHGHALLHCVTDHASMTRLCGLRCGL
jgi:hypothetical protein